MTYLFIFVSDFSLNLHEAGVEIWARVGQWRKMEKMTKPLKFCAREEKSFHQRDDFDNLHWNKTRKSLY